MVIIMEKKRGGKKVLLVLAVIAALIILARMIFGGAMFLGSGLTIFDIFSGEEGNLMEHKYEYEWDSQISGLDISWISADVQIKTYEGEGKIKITEYASRLLEEKDFLQLSQGAGTLKIKWRKDGIFPLFNRLRKRLIVELPRTLAEDMDRLTCDGVSADIFVQDIGAKEMEFSSTSGMINLYNMCGDRLKASSVSGSAEVGGLTFNSIGISNTSGKISATEIYAQRADISTVSGGISLQGEIDQDIKMNAVSGDMTADISACPQKVNFSTVSGGMELAVPDNSGFIVKYSGVSGGLKTDFIGDFKGSGSAVYGDGAAELEMSTVSGEMRLLKK